MRVHQFSRLLTAGAGLCGVLLLSGCFDTRQEFTLNPDGSGKVVHECRFDDYNPFGNDANPEEEMKAAVRRIIQESKGVDAWCDVDFRREEDGRVYFRGTAYFRQLADLEIPNQTLLDFSWVLQSNGHRILSQRPRKPLNRPEGLMSHESAGATNLSPAELARQVRENRTKLRAVKSVLDQTIGRMKQETIFHLPGRIGKASNFEAGGPGEVRIRADGAKLLAALDRYINDEDWMVKHTTGTNNPTLDPEVMAEVNRTLFGQKGPVQVEVGPGAKPLFDYAAEVRVAREDFARVQKAFQFGVVSVSSAGESGFKSVQLAGVQLVALTDENRRLRPFYGRHGCTLAILGDFAGTVLAVSGEGTLDAAIADDGSSLLPDSEWERRIASVSLSSDKTAVLFEVRTKVPGPGITTLKKVSGRLQYTSETGDRQLDLGFKRLEPGAVGTELGARIKSMRSDMDQRGHQIELTLNTPMESFKSAALAVDGVRSPLRKTIIYGSTQSCTVALVSNGSIPAHGRLVVELIDRIANFTAPFELENVSLPLISPVKTVGK